jgi:REP element-mobilizing transposase RayT
MARLPRDLSRSEWFHLVQRGADRQDIFAIDSDRLFYETLVAEAFGRWGVEPHAYALMTNHTHLLARVPAGGSLSDAMHHLGSRYALAFNRSSGRDGPLFTSRFHSTPITTDAQLILTARYIHRNPLAFVPLGALVTYRWSSLGPICGRRTWPDWLAGGTVGAGQTHDELLRFVLSPRPSDRLPTNGCPPLTRTTLDEIVRSVARLTGVAPEELLVPTQALAEPRTLAMMLVIELRAASADEAARRFGLADTRSVRRAARRGRERVARSADFAERRRRVVRSLDTDREDRRAA